MTLTPAMITFDSSNPGPLARWWAEQTDGRIDEENDGWFYTVVLPSVPYRLAFQKVDEPTPGKNRIHLDLTTSDLAAERSRLVASGASEVAEHTMGDFTWVTFADPDGNVFCISGAH
ncbi:VOC family protein [Rhodococcus sp. H36-A4]|uniref:VOC family protein n=1 Tax=unclassified Rhodococcus (in: high G+C Gram-positive bacteria) TaxID=192944 RepID=UPI0022AEF1E6|nr:MULTISPECIES: VOC family protein [unclassified Rhodococcus (in: high G+C Gram-positive bacteria)]MCZ4076728.1 VOC family protein [Rhodococcus sp. H36-A4]MDJ0360201.1 VOC family protein [Rhodococcus sp. H29-C3]